MKCTRKRMLPAHACNHEVKERPHTLVHGSILDVANGGSLHNVAHEVAVDGLVLGHAAAAVIAADGLDVATTVLAASVVPALLGLLNGKGESRGGGGSLHVPAKSAHCQ